MIRAALGGLTLVATAVQLSIVLRTGGSPINFFSYFTILSNLIVGIVLLTGTGVDSRDREAPRWFALARFAATLYIAIVGIVFALLLRNADLGPLLPWINIVHHYVLPLAVVIDWFVRPPTRRPSWRDVVVAFGFPMAYVAYTLVRGAAVGWYPYPFLNPAVVDGYAGVALYVVGIIAVFIVVAALLRWRTADIRPLQLGSFERPSRGTPVPPAVVEALTSLAADSKRRNISPRQAIRETGYPEVSADLMEHEVEAVLRRRPELLDSWVFYSQDQRCTPAWYLSEPGMALGQTDWRVGYFDDPKKQYFWSFPDEYMACAFFVTRYVERLSGRRTSYPPA